MRQTWTYTLPHLIGWAVQADERYAPAAVHPDDNRYAQMAHPQAHSNFQMYDKGGQGHAADASIAQQGFQQVERKDIYPGAGEA